MTKINMSEDWIKFWKKNKNTKIKLKLNSFQRIMIRDLSKEIEKNNCTNLLSAGSGIDIVSYHLIKKYPHIKITILDISPEVLDINKKIIKSKNAKFIVGDLFNLKLKPNSFDLIFNSGVLEHFSRTDQKKIVSQLLTILKKNKKYYTYNPSKNGKLYIYGMMKARRNKEWDHEIEEPIESLNFLKQNNHILEIREEQVDGLSQLCFLVYLFKNKWYKKIVYLIVRISEWPILNFILDNILKLFFGTYILKTVIQKK